MNVGMGGKIEKSHKEWIGKWYKPWTYPIFSDKYIIYIIDYFKFIEMSIVANPIDPCCRIKR